MRIALTVAAVAASAVTLAPSAAHGEDQRPCVSNREFNSLHVQTRESLEERWEVAGLGRQRMTPMYGAVAAYPWCGHPMGEAWVGIDYAQRGTNEIALGVVLYRRGSSEPPAPPVTSTTPPTVVPCDASCGSGRLAE